MKGGGGGGGSDAHYKKLKMERIYFFFPKRNLRNSRSYN